MRAGPVGLFCFGCSDDLVRTAHDQGRITHQDRRCSAGAIVIAGAVALNLQEKTASVTDFVKQLSVLAAPFDRTLQSLFSIFPNGSVNLQIRQLERFQRRELQPGLMTGGQESLRLSPPACFGAYIHSYGVQMITWNLSAPRLELAGMSIQPLR